MCFDPITITLIVGIATLLIERAFVWLMKVKKSSCTVEMKKNNIGKNRDRSRSI